MKIRRSLLFLPGNNPGMLQSGGVFEADGVILDLEDAVSPLEKDSARFLIAQALRTVNYRKSETFVRINPLSSGGAKDIQKIVPCQPNGLVLPKVESRAELEELLGLIVAAEKEGQRPVSVIPLIETPLGVNHCAEIAQTDKRVIALAFGAEDYTAALGATRTKEGGEILMARSLIINAAAAAGIDSIDTPFTDAQDEEGLLQDSLLAKKMGFKGKLAINPRQVEIIHDAFNPSPDDIRWAKRVLRAIEDAQSQGSGVIALDGKMIDAPIVRRAERVLYLAETFNLTGEVDS